MWSRRGGSKESMVHTYPRNLESMVHTNPRRCIEELNDPLLVLLGKEGECGGFDGVKPVNLLGLKGKGDRG